MSVTSEASQKCVTETKKDGNLLLEKNSVQNFCLYDFRGCCRFELEMIFSPEKYFRFKVFLLLENVHLKIFLLFSFMEKKTVCARKNFSTRVFFCLSVRPRLPCLGVSFHSFCLSAFSRCLVLDGVCALARTHTRTRTLMLTHILSLISSCKQVFFHTFKSSRTHTHTHKLPLTLYKVLSHFQCCCMSFSSSLFLSLNQAKPPMFNFSP